MHRNFYSKIAFVTTFSLAALICTPVWAQELLKEGDYKPEDTEFYEPVPPKVKPGKNNQPPSDAIVLFDGKDLSKWEGVKEGSPQIKYQNGHFTASWTSTGEPKWEVKDGYFTVNPDGGSIKTKENFGDFQLHIEWRQPQEVKGEGQGRGNSGIFLQGLYEVQILDSYENKTYTNGQAGSIYKQHPPLVNAMTPPSEWEVYDIIYTAPKFSEKNGAVLEPGYVTVLHNGVLIQNHVELQGDTPYIGTPRWIAHGEGPIALQNHGNPVSFRNIWIRELNRDQK